MATESGPPWPGFVDALSTVLMMMVFFTLLMVLVTGTLSYIVALKEVSPNAAASTEQVETKVAAAQDLAYLNPPSSKDKLQQALNKSAELDSDDLARSPIVSPEDVDKIKKENKQLRVQVAVAENKANKAERALQKLRKEYDPDLADKLAAALEKINRLEAEGGVDKKVNTDETFVPPPFVTKLVTGINNRNRVIVLYNQLTSTLEDKTRKELLSWIAANESVIRQKGMQLVATLNHAGVSSSMSNSVSFKRLYSLIKVVNIEGGIPKHLIKFRALSDGVPGTNQVVVSIGNASGVK